MFPLLLRYAALGIAFAIGTSVGKQMLESVTEGLEYSWKGRAPVDTKSADKNLPDNSK